MALQQATKRCAIRGLSTDLKTWNRVELRQFPWLGYQAPRCSAAVGRRGHPAAGAAGPRRAVLAKQTAAAVMTIQERATALDANGIVDPGTWRAVIAQAPR